MYRGEPGPLISVNQAPTNSNGYVLVNRAVGPRRSGGVGLLPAFRARFTAVNMGTVGGPTIGRTPGDPWVTAVNRGLLLRSGTE